MFFNLPEIYVKRKVKVTYILADHQRDIESNELPLNIFLFPFPSPTRELDIKSCIHTYTHTISIPLIKCRANWIPLIRLYELGIGDYCKLITINYRVLTWVTLYYRYFINDTPQVEIIVIRNIRIILIFNSMINAYSLMNESLKACQRDYR